MLQWPGCTEILRVPSLEVEEVEETIEDGLQNDVVVVRMTTSQVAGGVPEEGTARRRLNVESVAVSPSVVRVTVEGRWEISIEV